MKTILIIEQDNYRRNKLTKKMVDHGFLVFDVKDQFEAIDIVLSLAESSPIHYLLASAEQSPYPTLIKFCVLKFGTGPKILFQPEMSQEATDKLLA